MWGILDALVRPVLRAQVDLTVLRVLQGHRDLLELKERLERQV